MCTRVKHPIRGAALADNDGPAPDLGRPAIRDLEAQWATGWAALATARPTGTGRPPGRNLKIRSWATMTFQDASLNLPGCRRGTPGET